MLAGFARLGLVVLMVALAGCAASTQSPSAMPVQTAQAGGSWSGYAGEAGVSAPVALSLTQSGSNVVGSIDVGGRPDMSGPVIGTVDGNALQLKLQTGFGSLPMMTVGKDQISGILSIGRMTLRRVN